MKDHLNDLVKHTHALGVFDLVRVKGSDETCEFDSISDDRTVILKGYFKDPLADLMGTFGLPNISKLNALLGIPEYQENSKITLLSKTLEDGSKIPSGLRFENAGGDFKNDYRFMASSLVNEKLKSVAFRGATWNITITPSTANILKLKYQQQANSEETYFTAKTDGTDLKFFFGDHSTHAGDFVFQSGVNGKLTKNWKWPVGLVLNILNLAGDKTFKFSDDGVALITVDSGIAVYEYYLPAWTK